MADRQTSVGRSVGFWQGIWAETSSLQASSFKSLFFSDRLIIYMMQDNKIALLDCWKVYTTTRYSRYM